MNDIVNDPVYEFEQSVGCSIIGMPLYCKSLFDRI